VSESAAPSASLRELAEQAGIASEYEAAGSGERRETSDDTRRRLLAALGFDASNEAAARAGLEALRAAPPRPQPAGELPRCVSVEERLGQRRVFGIWANLYTLRRSGGLGFGDLGALRALVRLAGAWGAAFVGLNPLHALRNRGADVSPYAPLSRLYRNPLYLDVEAVPELASCAEARRALDSPQARRRLALLRGAARLDYAALADLQREVLLPLHRDFARLHRERDTARGRELRAYRAREGERLREFALFLTLEDELAARGLPRDWRHWPPEYRTPRSSAVHAFAAERREELSFHEFVQFELERQLGEAAREAADAGLALGLYQDLALGSAPSGFDSWAFPELHVPGVTLGAPPDDYAAQGQDWGLPPLHPLRVTAQGAELWQGLLRRAFAHAGALRLDHVMGLVRQFWIPAGQSPAAGAYLHFPAEELLAALARESRRAGALVIGEDLGTLPRGLPELLARFAVLSSQVLLFERESDGSFRPAAHYSGRALATANTHDLPPLAGFWSARDLELRGSLGLLAGEDLAAARRARERDCALLRRRLVDDGLLAAEGALAEGELCGAVSAFLCRTPAPLVGLSLDDLAGEEEPVNLPGVPPERHASWTRRMALCLEELAAQPGVARALAGAASRSHTS
jgi:4-alpha-glucanotransferase